MRPDGADGDAAGADGPDGTDGDAVAGRIREGRFRVVSVVRDTLRRRPPAPFTTSTLQQEASRRLGFSVAETMAVAQRLYEGVDLGGETAGLITYMRTDSPAMAKTAVADARAAIRKAFGGDCVPAKPRAFRARSRPGPHAAREAHEAIRPTDFSRAPEDLGRRLDRAGAALYGLIWKRALASQMAEARFDRVRVELAGDAGGPAGGLALAAEGVALAFDGHLRARGPGDGDAGEETGGGSGVCALAALKEGDRVSAAAVRVERHVAEPPPRYTEAGLVRRLDALGIGRPSTWAAILAVLRERGYALVHERRFVPTERGRVVTAFLEGFFGGWVDYGFTAAMEADLDRIAGGSLAWRGMLEDFWGGFHAALEGAGTLERADVLAAVEDRLGGFLFGAGPQRRRCPSCGRDTLALKLSRYGPFVGCGDYPACGYRRGLAAGAPGDGYAGPRDLGTDPGAGLGVTLRRGPNGWYVQRGERAGKDRPERMSLPPALDPDSVDLDLARQPAGAAPGGRASSGDRRADPGRDRPLRPLAAAWRHLRRHPGRRGRAGGRHQPRRRPDRRQGDPGKPRPGAEAGAGQARPAPRRRRPGLAQDRPLRPLRRPPAALCLGAGGHRAGRPDARAGGRSPGPVARASRRRIAGRPGAARVARESAHGPALRAFRRRRARAARAPEAGEDRSEWLTGRKKPATESRRACCACRKFGGVRGWTALSDRKTGCRPRPTSPA